MTSQRQRRELILPETWKVVDKKEEKFYNENFFGQVENKIIFFSSEFNSKTDSTFTTIAKSGFLQAIFIHSSAKR